MLKFLTLLLELFNRLLAERNAVRWKKQGREETIKEMNDAINADVKQAEAAIAAADPERDDRLRSRFDRSRFGQ